MHTQTDQLAAKGNFSLTIFSELPPVQHIHLLTIRDLKCIPHVVLTTKTRLYTVIVEG